MIANAVVFHLERCVRIQPMRNLESEYASELFSWQMRSEKDYYNNVKEKTSGRICLGQVYFLLGRGRSDAQ